MLKAVASGKYDPHKIAFGITQTGGQCRASSYIDIIRRALKAAGYGHIPVLPVAVGGSLSARQPAFAPNWRPVATTFLSAVVFGDNLSQLYHAAAPREKIHGQAAVLRDRHLRAAAALVGKRDIKGLVKQLRQAAADFGEIIDAKKTVPAIGIVGEIYVKLNAFSQHNAVQWLLSHGVEPVLPPVSSFFMQHFANTRANARAHVTKRGKLPLRVLEKAVELYFQKIITRFDRACAGFPNFRPHTGIHHEAAQGARVVNLAAQFGEGWLIPAEILELLESGVRNVVSLQPFGCIANHIVAKGIERRVRQLHPEASLLYLDFDASTGEANVLNRLHFLVRNAKTESAKKAAKTKATAAAA
jgi:predicted nucleotide-binding protein (sugar kinase/HSP70/actin superfamily)